MSAQEYIVRLMRIGQLFAFSFYLQDDTIHKIYHLVNFELLANDGQNVHYLMNKD